MLTQNSLNNGARWSVMWLGSRGIVEKKFDDDFGGALRAYTTLKGAGKKLVTLRSCNVGFAPPRHLIPDMEQLNREGRWWCAYCVALRPFKRKADRKGRVTMNCPVCGISSNNWHIRRWNPQAKVIEYRRNRGRKPRRNVRRRTR